MFRKELEARLKEIFGFKKLSFDAASEAFEQDTLFVELGDCKTRPGDGKITARVTGQLVVYSQAVQSKDVNQKMTFGTLARRIEQASATSKKNFFFSDFDTNVENSPARLQNIHEWRTSFTFLYSAQYDPDRGQITSLTLEESES